MPILELFSLALSGALLAVAGGRLMFHRRLVKINQLLEKGEAREFIQATTEELDKQKNPGLKALLLMNLSAGFVFLGDFNVALNTLRQVDPHQFNQWSEKHRRRLKALYYNNLLNALLYNQRWDEAVALWSEKAEYLVPKTGYRLLDQCIEGSAATYHYFCGDAQHAYGILERLTQMHDMPSIYRAKQLYLLGRLDLTAGRFDQGMRRLEEAAQMSGQSYLAQEPKRLALGDERVGAPGSGRALPPPTPEQPPYGGDPGLTHYS